MKPFFKNIPNFCAVPIGQICQINPLFYRVFFCQTINYVHDFHNSVFLSTKKTLLFRRNKNISQIWYILSINNLGYNYHASVVGDTGQTCQNGTIYLILFLFLSRLSKIKLLAIISKLEQSGLPRKIAQNFFNEYFCFALKRIGSLFPKLVWPKGQEI